MEESPNQLQKLENIEACFSSSGKMSNEDSLRKSNKNNKNQEKNNNKISNYEEMGYNKMPEWQKLSWHRDLICPYNKMHIVSEMYMIFHLAKCPDGKQKGHLFKRCYFNGLHRIPNENYEDHLRNCPDIPQSYTIQEVEDIINGVVKSWDQEQTIEELRAIDLDNPWMPIEEKEKIKKLLEQAENDPFIQQQQIDKQKQINELWGADKVQQNINQKWQTSVKSQDSQNINNKNDLDVLDQQFQNLEVNQQDFKAQ